MASIALGGAAGFGEYLFFISATVAIRGPAKTWRRPGFGMAVLAKADAVFVGVVLKVNGKRSRGGSEENMVN